MEEGEYADLMRHIAGAMRKLGLIDLAERIFSDISIDAGPPSTQVDRFLAALESEIGLEASVTTGRIVDRLNDVARTAEGQPIEGIELELSAEDRALYGVDAEVVDLNAGSLDLTILLSELKLLRSALREAREDDGGWA